MKNHLTYQVSADAGIITASFKEQAIPELKNSEVLIRSCYSSINYKDALGVTGRGKIYRSLPMVAGIDVAGIIAKSRHPDFREGDEVLITGCGLGENQDGGFAEFVRAPGDWAVHLPRGLNLRESMILGTAGFTAALCLHRMEQNGQCPDTGPVLVTGASGGVGSLAVCIFAARGYRVTACSRKESARPFLSDIGADEWLHPDHFRGDPRPLEKGVWGAVVDNVGGPLLSALLPSVRLWGNVASIGLTSGHEFKTSVMPFILRGVSLLGISSANCPMPLRKIIWKRLAEDLKPTQLSKILQKEILFRDIPGAFSPFIEGTVLGRQLVLMEAQIQNKPAS
ncbi:MAG: YhdH/YhfP family quinone oxidoreductase [Deltaproteobacteria bacterium]|nr:YhdH/YhfP family quinone oxidoreductase [Deltaproteobacteria bacterium]